MPTAERDLSFHFFDDDYREHMRLCLEYLELFNPPFKMIPLRELDARGER